MEEEPLYEHELSDKDIKNKNYYFSVKSRLRSPSTKQLEEL